MKLKYKFLVIALLLSLMFSLTTVGAAEDVPFEQSETESVPVITETQENSNENLNSQPSSNNENEQNLGGGAKANR